jgi:hypothetical protein
MVTALLAAMVLAPAPWTENFNPDGTPKPLRDTADLTVWPNQTSRANGDIWISRNHDRIRVMRPRILLMNFVNGLDPARPVQIAEQLIAALRESSRYHGYKDPDAPAFLEYSIWRFVDLGDQDGPAAKNSDVAPKKPGVEPPHINCDYGAFFSDAFAKHIGVRDPKNPERYLNLVELIDQGFVHEVIFTGAADGVWRCWETVELKEQYDENFNKVPGRVVQAGNGGDPDQPWTGRPVRLTMLNYQRGIGCGMENLGHALEGMAHSRAIPYFTKYFHEFAGFDLDERWGLPFNSFYPLWGEGKGISYPDPRTAVVTDGTQTWRLENYYVKGGNVHFLPNGRFHYDMRNPDKVMSTIEDWRIGSGPGGEDRKEPWGIDRIQRYAELAPDCMGKWLVYWRQNMPGFRNRQKDDEGRPMKNWWPFLFY